MGGPLAWADASQFALLNQAPYTLEPGEDGGVGYNRPPRRSAGGSDRPVETRWRRERRQWKSTTRGTTMRQVTLVRTTQTANALRIEAKKLRSEGVGL